ncbi:MAG: Ig-like domain-containing protein [Gemmataceae bacterium]
MFYERNPGRRSFRPILEPLEDRCLLTFSVSQATILATDSWRLVADFDQDVNLTSVQPEDIRIDGIESAVAVNAIDADTVEFELPALAAGTHVLSIDMGTIVDATGAELVSFHQSVQVVTSGQFTVKHTPRLQLGDAPLTGFAGSDRDRVDILWQTIPATGGTQDSFTVEYRAEGATPWHATGLNTPIDTGVEGRVVRSATISGLDWNSNYEYRVRHWRADVVVGQYQNVFHTRLEEGDDSAFTFVAYGDSATGSALGFRQVQSRINQMAPDFAVLLGDNVYTYGSHQESDARFDPGLNPEATTWMAGHIDYLGLGNHDVSTGSGLPSEQNYSVPIPVAGVTASTAPPITERNEHNFSWDYGNVHFVTFDTNSYSDANRLNELLDWVVSDLQDSHARWKIVYGHHPLAGVPDKPENPGGNYYQQVVNRLKAAGVDLFMTGHSHTYSWTYPLTGQVNGRATYVNHGVDNEFHAGEGLTQLVSGVGGNEVRSGDYNQFSFVAEGFTSTTPVSGRLGFTQVQVTPTQLTLSYIGADNGAVIDSFSITKDAAPGTVIFQQGLNGYSGTVDTSLRQNSPNANNGADQSLKVDSADPGGTSSAVQALLRFENLFGNNPGQIPLNAVLRSATLQLQISNTGNGINLHRMQSIWSANDTWNTLGSGVQANGSEAVVTPDISTGAVSRPVLSVSVLTSLLAWQAAPSSNRGWALLPTGPDGVDFNSSEGTTPPQLIVTYVTNTPPVAINDSATTRASTPVKIAVRNNDSDIDRDRLVIQSLTGPLHGKVRINADNTVSYTPAIGYIGPDSFSYTINDGRGGTATATVNLQVRPTLAMLLVSEVYHLSLNRGAGLRDQLVWSQFSNRYGLGMMVNAIEGSLEAKVRLAQTYYQRFLGRQASLEDALGWAHALQKQSNESIMTSFVTSQEFYQRSQRLYSGATADQRYIQALFHTFLNRLESPSKLASWVSLVSRQGRRVAAWTIVNSPECRVNYVAQQIAEVLDRPVEIHESYGWARTGLTMQQIRNSIMSSAEFVDRVKREAIQSGLL